MTRALPRTNFNRSKLSHTLEMLNLVTGVMPGHASVEQLAGWVDATAAMRLYAAHNAGIGAALVSTAPATLAELAEECACLRAVLAQAIEKSCSPGIGVPNTAGGMRIRLPVPDPTAPSEIADNYEPYRRFQLAHQREMETAIAPLRAKVRATLAQSGAAQAKLAALDTALGDILAGREAKLLAKVPALLEQRFVQQRDIYRQALAATGQTDDPAIWLQPDGWLAHFCQEMRDTLLAELDLRLQPVMGLIEAFSNEVSVQ